jgi:hypothetical protein
MMKGRKKNPQEEIVSRLVSSAQDLPLIRFFQNCCVWRATSLVVQVHISFDRGR